MHHRSCLVALLLFLPTGCAEPDCDQFSLRIPIVDDRELDSSGFCSQFALNVPADECAEHSLVFERLVQTLARAPLPTEAHRHQLLDVSHTVRLGGSDGGRRTIPGLPNLNSVAGANATGDRGRNADPRTLRQARWNRLVHAHPYYCPFVVTVLEADGPRVTARTAEWKQPRAKNLIWTWQIEPLRTGPTELKLKSALVAVFPDGDRFSLAGASRTHQLDVSVNLAQEVKAWLRKFSKFELATLSALMLGILIMRAAMISRHGRSSPETGTRRSVGPPQQLSPRQRAVQALRWLGRNWPGVVLALPWMALAALLTPIPPDPSAWREVLTLSRVSLFALALLTAYGTVWSTNRLLAGQRDASWWIALAAFLLITIAFVLVILFGVLLVVCC